MDVSSTDSGAPKSNSGQQQEDGKSHWPDFMKPQNFLEDAPYGNMKVARKNAVVPVFII
jgi:hypothetical protein